LRNKINQQKLFVGSFFENLEIRSAEKADRGCFIVTRKNERILAQTHTSGFKAVSVPTYRLIIIIRFIRIAKTGKN